MLEGLSQAEQLPRAFLVLTNSSKFNASAGKVQSELTVHTVLMGKKDAVEATEAETKKISHKEGHVWKNQNQVRPM